MVFLLLCLRNLIATGFAAPSQETTLITNAAERGNRSAQLLLGIAYQHGRDDLPQDDKLAANWIGKAAEQGQAYAQNLLGDFYAKGKGVSV